MSTSQTDDQIAETLAKEIEAKEYDRMKVLYAPLTVFQLTGLIQLALRHPGVTPNLRVTADRFLSAVREYFADSPTVMDVIHRGDDPDQDRPFASPPGDRDKNDRDARPQFSQLDMDAATKPLHAEIERLKATR